MVVERPPERPVWLNKRGTPLLAERIVDRLVEERERRIQWLMMSQTDDGRAPFQLKLSRAEAARRLAEALMEHPEMVDYWAATLAEQPPEVRRKGEAALFQAWYRAQRARMDAQAAEQAG